MTDPLHQTTTMERIARMRQTWREITESDNGECEMMADYRWACDELERLLAIANLGRKVCGRGNMNCIGSKLMKDIIEDWT